MPNAALFSHFTYCSKAFLARTGSSLTEDVEFRTNYYGRPTIRKANHRCTTVPVGGLGRLLAGTCFDLGDRRGNATPCERIGSARLGGHDF